jgi:hypothetical protein
MNIVEPSSIIAIILDQLQMSLIKLQMYFVHIISHIDYHWKHVPHPHMLQDHMMSLSHEEQ